MAKLFKETLAGKGLKELGKGLNQEGIYGPRGKRWCKTSIYHILTSEVYTGTLVWGRRSRDGKETDPVRVENAWLPIVDKETFDRVQSIIKQRAPQCMHPRRTSSHFLLSGLARCGNCGKSLVGQDAKSGRFSYYVCGTLLKQGSGTCNTPYQNAPNFERLVIDRIKERILTKENLRELVRYVNEEMDVATIENRKRLDTIATELDDVNRRLDRLYDSLESGKLDIHDLAPRIQKLRHQQDQLEAARASHGTR